MYVSFFFKSRYFLLVITIPENIIYMKHLIIETDFLEKNTLTSFHLFLPKGLTLKRDRVSFMSWIK